MDIFLAYFQDIDYLLDSMFAPFSVTLASFLRASFAHRFVIDLGKNIGLTFGVFVDTVSVRARNPLNLQTHLFLQYILVILHIRKT